MNAPSTTYAVLLTPEGRGAVASVLIAGPLAGAAVKRRFHRAGGKPFTDHDLERILVGRWESPEAGEEVVVCRRSADRTEVHCHGGRAAAQAIVQSLVAGGCREIDWQQWTRLSEPDVIAAEARIALADAPTERTAAILWDQYAGALALALDALWAEIAAGDARAAQRRLEELTAWSSLGRHLIDPWRVVFAGRPNVGKSSLLNALTGYQRAIVHATAGTTRDVVTALTAIDGWPVELADTAGLREGGEPLEAAGMRLAEERLGTADLVVWVVDASQEQSADDELPAGRWPRTLRIFNKCDLLSPLDTRIESATGAVYTSATQRLGIERLEREIARWLVPRVPQPAQAVPFTAAQIDLLERTGDCLHRGDMAAAGSLLAKAKHSLLDPS